MAIGGAGDARHDLVFQPRAQAGYRRTGEEDRPQRRMPGVGHMSLSQEGAERIDEALAVGEEQRSEVEPEAVAADAMVTGATA